MKKKIIYVVGGIVLSVMILVLVLFAFSGDNTTSKQTVDVIGTWKVVTYVNNGQVTFAENEYMVFEGERAEAYRDGSNEPYASSNFTIDSSGVMKLPEISRKYIVDNKSQNHIRLYETADAYICLIRCPNEDISNEENDASIVIGKWDVVYRNSDRSYTEEYLVFENGMLHDYYGDSESPTTTMNYIWEENQIVVSTINKTMMLHIISDTEIAFIETDTGYIWELKKDNSTN